MIPRTILKLDFGTAREGIGTHKLLGWQSEAVTLNGFIKAACLLSENFQTASLEQTYTVA